MKSPKRIAVVVLFSLLGLGVQYLFHVEVALALGILVGFVAANFVPLESACPLKKGGAGGTEDAAQGASSRDSFTSDRNSSR